MQAFAGQVERRADDPAECFQPGLAFLDTVLDGQPYDAGQCVIEQGGRLLSIGIVREHFVFVVP